MIKDTPADYKKSILPIFFALVFGLISGYVSSNLYHTLLYINDVTKTDYWDFLSIFIFAVTTLLYFRIFNRDILKNNVLCKMLLWCFAVFISYVLSYTFTAYTNVFVSLFTSNRFLISGAGLLGGLTEFIALYISSLYVFHIKFSKKALAIISAIGAIVGYLGFLSMFKMYEYRLNGINETLLFFQLWQTVAILSLYAVVKK